MTASRISIVAVLLNVASWDERSVRSFGSGSLRSDNRIAWQEILYSLAYIGKVAADRPGLFQWSGPVFTGERARKTGGAVCENDKKRQEVPKIPEMFLVRGW